MRKVFAALLCLIVLSGCGSADSELPDRLLDELNELAQTEIMSGANRFKRRYSYYLPKGMGQRDSNELSEVLIKDGYRVIMNFDPSAIVIKKYYSDGAQDQENSSQKEDNKTDMREDQEALDQHENSEIDTQNQDQTEAEKPSANDTLPVLSEAIMEAEEDGYRFSGTYRNDKQEIQPYTLHLVKGERNYLMYLNGEYVKLYSVVPRTEVSSMLRAMFTLMSGVRFDEAEIVKAYSLKSLTQTKKESLEYLEQHLPSSGSLQDLLSNEENNDADQDHDQ